MFKLILTAFALLLIATIGVIAYLNFSVKNTTITSTSSSKISSNASLNDLTMEIASTAFTNEGNLPIKYTCDGDGVNPPLEISMLPDDTKSIVLIVEDPDAKSESTFKHWLVWNIPSTATNIEENSIPTNAIVGKNDSGKNVYYPPCPPVGETHSYFFRAFALDSMLNLSTTTTRNDLDTAMQDHILDTAAIEGKYGR